MEVEESAILAGTTRAACFRDRLFRSFLPFDFLYFRHHPCTAMWKRVVWNLMSTEWINRLSVLQQTLTACPTDGSTRCELASLLERLNQHEDALIHWKTVLAADPNSLQAREGIARCLAKTGRPLQSPL
ncbi:MAG: hypothetical protein NTNFB02_37340 [Nitrospira sp.]